MQLPWKKMLEIGVGLAGVKLSEGQAIEIEKKENELLVLIAKQQGITNAILMKILEDQDPEGVKELMKELEE